MADKDENGTRQTMERDELWSQLQNAIHLRSSQDQILWTIFGIFGAANAILLIALFQNGLVPGDFPWLVIASAGMIASIVWRKLLGRALGHVKRHEELMKKLELQLKIPSKIAVSRDINREDYEQYLGRGLAARDLMMGFSLATALAWVAALVWSIIRIFCG